MENKEKEKLKEILWEIIEAIEEGKIDLHYVRRLVEEL